MKSIFFNLSLATALSAFVASDKTLVTDDPLQKIPPTVIWAWERPEDLRFIDTRETAVAYYAGIIHIRGDWASLRPRMNPLLVPKRAILYPVFRIEEIDNHGIEPGPEAIERTRKIICAYVRRHNSPVVQIDYDAVLTSRPAYLRLLRNLRRSLPKTAALSVTALASWCLDDQWLDKAPVDEAVAMLFTMGNDTRLVLSKLPNQRLNAGVKVQSIGASADEPRTNKRLKASRQTMNYKRLYLFNRFPWNRESYAKCKESLI